MTADPVAERRAEIAQLAERSFATHELVREGDGRWVCANPKSWAYWFRVVVAPGCIFLYGDIGELVLRPHDRDALAWLRQTDGVDYPLGKVPVELRSRDYLHPLATRALEDLEKEMPKQAAEIRDIFDPEDGDARSFAEAWYDVLADCEPPEVTDWGHSMLFCMEALRWFSRALDAEEAGLEVVQLEASGRSTT